VRFWTVRLANAVAVQQHILRFLDRAQRAHFGHKMVLSWRSILQFFHTNQGSSYQQLPTPLDLRRGIVSGRLNSRRVAVHACAWNPVETFATSVLTFWGKRKQSRFGFCGALPIRWDIVAWGAASRGAPLRDVAEETLQFALPCDCLHATQPAPETQPGVQWRHCQKLFRTMAALLRNFQFRGRHT